MRGPELTNPKTASRRLSIRFNSQKKPLSPWDPQSTAASLLELSKVTQTPSLPLLLCGPHRAQEMAKIMHEAARILVCSSRSACQVCGDCVALAHGQHPHVFGFNPKSAPMPAQLSIELLRQRMEELQIAPRGLRGFYIWILTDIENLHLAAQQSLLKSLEEPLAPTQFLLTTQQLGRLPETLISRCQTFSLEASASLQGHLAQWAQEQGRSKAEVQLLLKHAGGAPERCARLASNQAWEALQNHASDMLRALEARSRTQLAQAILGQEPDSMGERMNIYCCLLEDFQKLKAGFKPSVETELYFPQLQRRYLRAQACNPTWDLETLFYQWRRALKAKRDFSEVPYINRNLWIQHCIGQWLP